VQPKYQSWRCGLMGSAVHESDQASRVTQCGVNTEQSSHIVNFVSQA
jgi:hypothetical protein